MLEPLPIAVLASGEGTTVEALEGAIRSGRLPARIVLVLADRPGAPVLGRAASLGLPTVVLPRAGVTAADWSRRATEELSQRQARLVLLAGYLGIVPDEFLRDWEGRTINLHPSLLPRHGGRGMYGRRVHESVLSAGDRETGATVHLVTKDVDRGPVLWQARVPVPLGATSERLREVVRGPELEALLEVLGRFADGRWSLPYRPKP